MTLYIHLRDRLDLDIFQPIALKLTILVMFYFLTQRAVGNA